MVVGLRVVHTLGVLPGVISEQTEDRQDDDGQPESKTREQSGDNASVFHTEAKLGCNSRVNGQEDEPDCKTAWDRNHSILGPEIGDEGRFTERGDQTGCVKSSSPNPVSSNLAVALWQIVQPDQLRDKVKYERVVKAVCYPAEEGMHSEEHALLTQLVELRVSIKQTCRDVLIENAKDEGRHNREQDVVETHRPRFENDFSREAVLERIPELCHEKGRVLVVEIQDHFGDSLVGPRSMYKQQLAKVSELSDGHIGRSGCLKTFDTGDTDTDVCGLNH